MYLYSVHLQHRFALMHLAIRRFFPLALLFSLGAQTWAQQPSEATQRLLERNKMFVPQFTEVADNVYVSAGYQVTTSGFIIGEEGIIVVDPGIAVSSAVEVNQALREITDKPVKAIIYTHGHADHTNAAGVYYSEGVEVWARDNFDSENALVELNGYEGGVRASNTQGFDLPLDQRIGVGVGIPPERRPNFGVTLMTDGAEPEAVAAVPQAPPQSVLPTHTFSGDRQSLEIAGITIELVKAPGETDDQLYVWYPEGRVVFTGDNFYQSWPNTYPLRGTARRSVRDWVDSLSSMVPGHTTAMHYATTVLTNYRDALKWVLDRTIEGAKKKMTPDELIEYTELPEHLADLDYLQDYYGSRWGTVRDIYAQDLGWFDGDVLNLHIQSPVDQAQSLADLLGGIDPLADKAYEALSSQDYLSAAQLSDAWMKLEPENPQPWFVLAEALSIIGEQTFNAPARNYTLSSANRARKTAESLAE